MLDVSISLGTVAGSAGVLFRSGPGELVIAVAVSCVIDFSETLGVVTMVLEVLGDGDHVWLIVAEVCRQIPDANRIGPQSGHQAGSRRRADGLLTVGSQKRRSPCGQTIQVRTVDVFRAVAAQFRSHVIGGDEQDIQTVCFSRLEVRGEWDKQGEQEHGSLHGKVEARRNSRRRV